MAAKLGGDDRGEGNVTRIEGEGSQEGESSESI